LLEAQSTPLRNYLMQNVMPTMTLGLIECCRVRPDDPIDFLVCIQSHYTINTFTIAVLTAAVRVQLKQGYHSILKIKFLVCAKNRS